MHAVRKLALNTFEHMHRLSLRFHLERKTGGLTRVLERGRLGIENITRMTLMTFVPTIVEFALVLGVFAVEFDWRYVGAVAGDDRALPVVHDPRHRMAHPHPPRHERERQRGQHQGHRQPAQLRDGQVLRRRGPRGRRYDQSMAAYERASVKTYTSLAVLNTGQAVIFTLALTLCMVMSALDVIAGTQHPRPVHHGQRADAAALHPAQLHGHGLSRDQAGLTDIERMMDVLDENPEVADRPGARAARGHRRRHPLREREVPLRAGAARSSMACRSRCRPARWWRSSARRAPANRRSGASCCASTTSPAAA